MSPDITIQYYYFGTSSIIQPRVGLEYVLTSSIVWSCSGEMREPSRSGVIPHCPR